MIVKKRKAAKKKPIKKTAAKKTTSTAAKKKVKIETKVSNKTAKSKSDTSKSVKDKYTKEAIKIKLDLNFRQATSERDFKSIHEYTIEAFSDSPDFRWDLDEIKREVKSGWELYAAFVGKEVIAAVFLKPEGEELLSKNTSVKMNYQGSGYSHKIKDFVEKIAREKKINKIINYCGIDNFRMYSLNESHGYRKTGNRLGDKGQVVEWIKEIK